MAVDEQQERAVVRGDRGNRGAGVDWLGLVAAMTTVTLWSSGFVGVRALADEISPGPLALARLVTAALALSAVIALRNSTLPPSRGAWVLVIASGVFWFALYNFALNAASHQVDAGTAAMLVSTSPILIAVLGGLFLAEGFPPRLLIGCLIAFVGAVAIGLSTSSGATPGTASGRAIALLVVAALAYAAGLTLQKLALRTVSPLMVTWLACVAGAMVCLPFAPQLVAEAGRADGETLVALLYLGAGPMAVGFTTWAYALSRMSAGQLGSMTYLIPVGAILIGWLLLGEVAPPLALVGGALCVVGVVVARSWPRRGAPRVVAGKPHQGSRRAE